MKSATEIRAMLVECGAWFMASGEDINAELIRDMIADLDAVVDYGVGKPETRE